MKKIFFFIAIVICILLINTLLRSIYDLWSKQDLVVTAENDLKREKRENEKLKQQLVLVSDENFVETEARNKLFMVRPGESGVIVPEGLIQKKEKKEVENIPNWQKWINLFKN